jgi:kojibiose phosphorylase
LRLGLRDEAWAFWRRTGGFDLDIAHGGAAEGIHIANCGASWQVAVLGFAGMRTAMQADVLTLDPKLPDQWQRLAFPVVWQGCPAYVEITPGCCTVANRGEGELRVVVAGEERVVQAEETGVWAV